MKTPLKQTLKNMYALLDTKQKVIFVVILLLMIVSAVLTQLTPKAVGWLTDDILLQNKLNFVTIIPLLILILIANIVNEVIQLIRRLMVEDTATKTEKKARGIVTSALLKAPLAYFKENMTGYIHGRLNRCLEGTIKLEKLIFMDFAPAVFNSAAAIIVIITTLPLMLALPMLLVIPIGIAIVLRQISTQKGIRVALLETKSAMDGAFVELLNGIEVIRMTDSTQLEEQRFDTKSEFLRRKEMQHHIQMAKYDCFKFINEIFFTVFMLGTSAFLALNHQISVGAVLTSYLCFNQLLNPLKELHRILDELSESLILADDFFRMTDIQQDFSYQPVIPTKNIRLQMAPLIKIEHLQFGYNSQHPIIQDLSLDIEQGNFIGIAGPSGCGKSSLIKLICKLEQGQGNVWINGIDIHTLSRKDLAKIIALVPQEPFLIAGTIAQNIAYGLDQEPSQQALQEALTKANLIDFVNTLPSGLNTLISEGGANLSGGQKQRIAIARIFLRKPKIIILDEATSALDNTSERWIQQEIEMLKSQYGTTIISIAHRLTTLKNCDRILVMDKGSIVQEGKYDQLILNDGIFSEMYHGRLK